jgi:hypothetical protein
LSSQNFNNKLKEKEILIFFEIKESKIWFCTSKVAMIKQLLKIFWEKKKKKIIFLMNN